MWINVPRYAKNPIANDWVLPMIGQQRYIKKVGYDNGMWLFNIL
jgi:hypothetical protein